jgi:ferredoxin--NADP+ reductase
LDYFSSSFADALRIQNRVSDKAHFRKSEGKPMHRILYKEKLGPDITLFKFHAPDVAAYREPGQFVLIRISDEGERIPITIADVNRDEGSITLIIQSVGKTTLALAQMTVGDSIPDIAGPLGKPTHIQKVGHVVCVGGGIGTAPLYPVARGMRDAGNRITSILGARTANLLILEDRMAEVSHRMIITTDDGSKGRKGLVTDAISELVEQGEKFDQCIAMGPPIMMKFVCLLTKKLGIPTIVSLNPVMVDGTGMCGGCRVTVGGKTKFACVDGPEFDGHEVDFDEMMARLNTYKNHERIALEHFSGQTGCRLDAFIKGGAK